MRTTVIVAVVLVAVAAGLAAQDPLSAAKDLYASAAYEDALSTLNRLDGGSTAPELARQADAYRAFCLFALGRTREAESIAESMIRQEPLAALDTADVSPRLVMMFADVRKRLLPSLIRDRFRTARTALDQKSFATAERPLNDARLMILEAEKLGVKDDALADLDVLVGGFLQLIQSSAEQRTTAPAPSAVAASAAAVPPPAAPRPIAAPAGSAAASRVASNPPASTAASRPASAPPAPGATARSTVVAPAVGGPGVYAVDDEGVSPPVVIDQRIPAMTFEMQQISKALHTTGVLDVVIDESGSVVDATMRQSVNSSFDALIVRGARRWKYRPAMKDGVPVRFVKTLVLVP
jgi:TonB family protein